MAKKRKFRSQVVTFNIPSTLGKDLFLEFAMDAIGDKYVHLESKSDKITFHMEGDRKELTPFIDRLNSIAHQLNQSMSEGEGGYEYHSDLLKKLFNPHLKLTYFRDSLRIFGYEAKIKENILLTNANYFSLKSIHQKAAQAQEYMQSDQNRDIQRFFSLVHLQTGKEQFEIAEIAIENGILRVVDSMYQFAIDKTKAFEKMMDVSIEKTDIPAIEISEDEEFDINEFFEGGKLTFMKNGEELDLDRDAFDTVENNKDREELP